jgi:hypothetical protein
MTFTLLGRVDLPGSRVRIVLAAFILPLLCQSCLGLSQVESPVSKDSDRFVRVEVRYGDANPAGPVRFNHPLELSEREWTRILENVWVQYEPGALALAAPKEPSKPAFTPDEITFLSKWLGRAFKIARPDEWVVFGLRRQRSPELAEITTGGWYVEGDRLNLWLANYRHVVSMALTRQQMWDDPLQSSGDRYYSFAPGDFQTAALVGGGPLGELRGTAVPQLIINYRSFLGPPAAPKPVQMPVEKPAPMPLERPTQKPAQKPLEKPAEKPAPMPMEKPVEKPDVPQAVVAPEQGAGGDFTRKLRELKQLRDEGLITEEEYRTKKRQMLDRF